MQYAPVLLGYMAGRAQNIERRLHRRYQMIDLPVIWKSRTGDRGGLGRLRDISSGGVCFETAEILPPGLLVDVSIEWPVRLDESCRLQLKIEGLIIRSDERATAVSFSRYKFDTRKTDPSRSILADEHARP